MALFTFPQSIVGNMYLSCTTKITKIQKITLYPDNSKMFGVLLGMRQGDRWLFFRLIEVDLWKKSIKIWILIMGYRIGFYMLIGHYHVWAEGWGAVLSTLFFIYLFINYNTITNYIPIIYELSNFYYPLYYQGTVVL